MTWSRGITVAALGLACACAGRAEFDGDPPGGFAGSPLSEAGAPAISTGGAPGSGGYSASGGEETGGRSPSGGMPSTGGESATGGAYETGGASATGGSEQGATGGAQTGGAPPCDEVRWYLDADGDGFGDPNTFVDACEKPSGYVANGDDCYDENPAVKPGQTGWFTSHRGDGSFDYDCIDGAEPRYTEFALCGERDGWPTGSVGVPACGTWEYWYYKSSCQPQYRQQACR